MTKNNVLVFEKGYRKVRISKTRDNKYYMVFFFMNDYDYEWKKGSHGMYCDVCDTLTSAKAKAKRYINK